MFEFPSNAKTLSLVLPEFLTWCRAQQCGAGPYERLIDSLSSSASGEWADVPAGTSPNLYVTGLSSVAWWDSQAFDWQMTLEQATDDIFQEFSDSSDLVRRHQSPGSKFQGRGTWNASYIVASGLLLPSARQLFPRTMRRLAGVPGALSAGMTYFSSLRPSSSITPHSGFTNAHLRCHLCLSNSEGSWLRVGAESRPWELGKVFVFDDTFEHEASNDGSLTRTVLLFDIFHPMLDTFEQQGMVKLVDLFRRQHMRSTMASTLPGALT